MKARNFKDLGFWRLGIEIVTDIYSLTQKFPKSEMFGLSSQMRRAGVSIPSNIAEGFNRLYNKEFRQFLYMALGSCAELETQLEISSKLKFINEDQLKIILEKLDHESRTIKNYIKKL